MQPIRSFTSVTGAGRCYWLQALHLAGLQFNTHSPYAHINVYMHMQSQWQCQPGCAVLLRYNPVHQALELAYSTTSTDLYANAQRWLEWIWFSDAQRIQHLNSDPTSELIWSDQVHRLGINYLAHRLGHRSIVAEPALRSASSDLLVTHADWLDETTQLHRARIIQRVRSLKHRNKLEHNLAIDASITWEHNAMTQAEHAAHRRRLLAQGRIPWL
jgi:hypothetical protein